MNVAFGNMWATVEDYVRSSTLKLLEQFNGQAIKALGDAGVFDQTVIEAIDRLPSSLEGKLETCISLAYASDCLRTLFDPILKRKGESWDYSTASLVWRNNADSLMPMIEPLAKCYAQHIDRYAKFTRFSKRDLNSFLVQFINDTDYFGGSNDATHSGFRVCAYVAMLKGEEGFFKQFIEQFVMRLFDRSAAIAENVPEAAKVKSLLVSRFAVILEDYRKFISDGVPPQPRKLLEQKPSVEVPSAASSDAPRPDTTQNTQLIDSPELTPDGIPLAVALLAFEHDDKSMTYDWQLHPWKPIENPRGSDGHLIRKGSAEAARNAELLIDKLRRKTCRNF